MAEFKRLMMRIERADPKVGDKECAVEWLRKILVTQWARSHFPIESKCDVLVHNICESFNNYILDAKDKPIITMFEMIRTRLMTRLQVKRMGMEKYNGVICPNIIKKVDKVSSMAKYWCVNWAGAEKYEVMQIERKKLNKQLQQRHKQRFVMQHADIEAQQTKICMQHSDIGTTRPKPSSAYTSFRNEALLVTRRLVASNLGRRTPAPAQSHEPSTMLVDVTVVSSSLASSSHPAASNLGRLKRATESQVVENIRKELKTFWSLRF